MAAATDTVFGLMGNGNALFIRELAELGVSVVPVRHEAAAVAAADAFQRATRRLAVATTTYGPGFTNALTPLIDAALSRSPLLFIAGSTETVDHAALARACGARVETDPSEAVRVALEESVPVVLFLPWEPPQAPVSGSPGDVSSLLDGAQQMLIVVGRGAVEAREEVIALAERWGAAVATTAPAKGFFEGASGVRDLGICGGFATPEARAAMREADVVLVLGASLNRFTEGGSFGPDAYVIQIDPHSPTTSRIDTPLRGTVEEILPELVVEEGAGKRTPVRMTHAEGDELAPDGRLDPRTLFARLNELLPRERVVVTDGGHFIAWPCMYLDVPAPDHLVLVGTGFETIGLGLGAAVGVIEAADERLTVLVTGDAAVAGASSSWSTTPPTVPRSTSTRRRACRRSRCSSPRSTSRRCSVPSAHAARWCTRWGTWRRPASGSRRVRPVSGSSIAGCRGWWWLPSCRGSEDLRVRSCALFRVSDLG